METPTLDRVARRIAGGTTRRSVLGAVLLGALGSVGLTSGPASAFRQATPELEDDVPPQLPVEPDAMESTRSGDVIRRGALHGNFEHFCRIVPYQEHHGLAIMEDDIIIGIADELDGSDCVVRSGQAAPIEGGQFRWPYGLVPFMFHSTLTDAIKQEVITAVNTWNSMSLGLTWIWWYEANAFLKANLDRPPGTKSAPDVVWFFTPQDTERCFSSVGRIGGPQWLGLTSTCSLRATLHEMAHTAGLFHEHQRPDRDQFIEIAWDNIEPNRVSNFELKSLIDLDIVHTPYDYESITHYDARAFSRNGMPTILTPNGEDIGQGDGLSDGDRVAIMSMYPYPSVCTCPSFGVPCECAM